MIQHDRSKTKTRNLINVRNPLLTHLSRKDNFIEQFQKTSNTLARRLTFLARRGKHRDKSSPTVLMCVPCLRLRPHHWLWVWKHSGDNEWHPRITHKVCYLHVCVVSPGRAQEETDLTNGKPVESHCMNSRWVGASHRVWAFKDIPSVKILLRPDRSRNRWRRIDCHLVCPLSYCSLAILDPLTAKYADWAQAEVGLRHWQPGVTTRCNDRKEVLIRPTWRR